MGKTEEKVSGEAQEIEGKKNFHLVLNVVYKIVEEIVQKEDLERIDEVAKKIII